MWYLYLSEPPVSHLLIAWRETPIFSASASCERAQRFLQYKIFSESVIFVSSVCFLALIMPHFAGQSYKLWLELSQPMVAKALLCRYYSTKRRAEQFATGKSAGKVQGAEQASGGVFVHLAQKGKADFFAFAHGAIAKKQGAGKVLSKTTEFLFFLEMRRLL